MDRNRKPVCVQMHREKSRRTDRRLTKRVQTRERGFERDDIRFIYIKRFCNFQFFQSWKDPRFRPSLYPPRPIDRGRVSSVPGASPLARALDEDEADIEPETREREREGGKQEEWRKENRGGNELSRAISFAERSSFGSANAPVPRRNRKLRLGFHLRCCAESWCPPWRNSP